MSVGWIDNIYNNGRSTWYLKSVDDHNNGALAAGKDKFTLDDHKYHALSAGTHYNANWCGIPWYFEGKHYKVISQDKKTGVLFYTSEIKGRNWIVYEQLNTGRQIARQAVPTRSDFHCNMRFEADGVFIDVVNNNRFSGENAALQVMGEAKEWVKALAPIFAAAIQANAKTPPKPK